MTMFRSRSAVSLAALAALTLTASPAAARGYGPPHHYRHHDGVDGGDLLAGLLIGGAVVAIASAASKPRNDSTREDPARYPGGSYAPDTDAGYVEVPAVSDEVAGGYPGGPVAVGGFDGAVDACTGEIERGDNRIATVDNVRRMGERYSVDGFLEDGRGYACSVDDAGQIRSVAVDGHGMI